jgi:hypothetical protein
MREEVHVLVWWGDESGRDHLKDPGVDGRIILKWIFKKKDTSMNWIELVQDRKRWWALVNAVKNLRVPYDSGNCFNTWETVRFSGRLCSMELLLYFPFHPLQVRSTRCSRAKCCL